MKGCARSCLTGLVGFLVAIYAAHLLFQSFGLEADASAPSSFFAGAFATLAITLLWSARGVRQHRRLLRDATEGVSPVDGKWAGLSGVIRSSSPLTSPLGGKSVVAYKYKIYRLEKAGKGHHTVPYYEGVALAASTISTNLGTFRLLSVPEFDMESSEVAEDVAVRNARAYVAATVFEDNTTGQERRGRLEKEWTDDDGVYRRDREGPNAVDIADCLFDEKIIGQGEPVCVLGLYSQLKGGIIPDPNWAHQTKVIRGDGEAGIAQLGLRARGYVIAAFVAAAFAVGICWFTIAMP